MPHIWTVNQANQNDWPKEAQKKCPHRSYSNCHEGATQQHRDSPLSLPMCLTTHTVILFPPDKYLTRYTTFHLRGDSFLQS